MSRIETKFKIRTMVTLATFFPTKERKRENCDNSEERAKKYIILDTVGVEPTFHNNNSN